MLAAELGYADQSHLVREFGEFTGTSPAGLLAMRPGAGGRDHRR
jgi:AraC-like DNA-binding protein